MSRFFNIAGPCEQADHYMLPPLRRLDDVFTVIDQKKYFVVHAPRQSGKTTALRALARELTQRGRYAAALVSMERGAPFPAKVGAAERAILRDWQRSLKHQLPLELRPPTFPDAPPGARIGAALEAWAEWSPRPLVVLLDEIDTLRGVALDSVLRQIRSGYTDRPAGFPWSLALIGLRDVRDYEGHDSRAGSGSPFNIISRSFALANFTFAEVVELYGQHSADTGQLFTPEACACAFDLTQGQPWLINALGAVLVQELVQERSAPILASDVGRARELLVRRQQTHLDSLSRRLREARVRAVIEPMLAGEAPEALPPDDIQYVIDLGLIRRSATGSLQPANAIYREVILTALATTSRDALPTIEPTWLDRSGRLDPDRLLGAFLAFWRRHGQPLLRTTDYHEIAPHIVLMAFLDRVVNGGGTLEREYAIGSGRLDVCLRHGSTVLALELKVWRDRRPDPLEEGLEQLDPYLAGLGQTRGWLVIFDCRSGRPPIAERTTTSQAETPARRTITVIRA